MNDLKANLDSVGGYFKRQNGAVFSQSSAAVPCISSNKFNGGKH